MTISQMASMNTTQTGFSVGTNGFNITESEKTANDVSKFQKMLENASKSNMSSRLNGEYTSSFNYNKTTSTSSQLDKNAKPQGFAANAIGAHSTNSNSNKTIDKTSKLYETSLELENFFVKMMLSSMRNTVQKSGFGGNDSYASKMYEDMMYDELSVNITKNAGFGLADQIYLSLANK